MSKRIYALLIVLGMSGWVATGTAIAQEPLERSNRLTPSPMTPEVLVAQALSATALPQPKTYWMLQRARVFPEAWSDGPDLPAYRAFFIMLEQGLQAHSAFHEVLPMAQKMSGLSNANLIWLSRRLANVGELLNEYAGAETIGNNQTDGYWLLKQGRMFPRAWSDGPDLIAYRAFFSHLSEGRESGLAFETALNLAQKLSGVSDSNLVWLTQRLASISAAR